MKKLFTLLFLALSLSAFSTSITFEVSMKGSGTTYDSVFIVGSQTNWEFVQMTDQGDSVYSVTMNLNSGDTATYYFITIGYWAANYLDYRETVPADCDSSAELAGWDGDRSFIVPAAAAGDGKRISFVSACDIYEFNENKEIVKITSYCIPDKIGN